MDKAFPYLHARTLGSFIALSVLLMACAPPTATAQVVNTPAQMSEPSTVETQSETRMPSAIPQPSSLVFPYISGDAGNFSVLAGETITITLENAPTGADK
jgi:hypothetical protein